MIVTNEPTMPKKKPDADPKPTPTPPAAKDSVDLHRPRKMTAVREQFIAGVTELADRLGTDVTEIVNQAIREKLEREGLWPSKQKSEAG